MTPILEEDVAGILFETVIVESLFVPPPPPAKAGVDNILTTHKARQIPLNIVFSQFLIFKQMVFKQLFKIGMQNIPQHFRTASLRRNFHARRNRLFPPHFMDF